MIAAVLGALAVSTLLLWLFPSNSAARPEPTAWCVIPARTAIRIDGQLYLFDSASMLPCRLLPIERRA